MVYSKLQKFISAFVLSFLLFNLVFRFPDSFFSQTQAGNSKLYSLVSILVNENIYNGVKSSVETYAKDISKQLDNTKVVIIPTPKNTSSFKIASLLENLYYEGYKGVDKNANFKSKLVGVVFVGDFVIPKVYKNKQYSTTILPYVDFENKAYIYDHKTKKYIVNRDNIDGIKAEIWHGFISPHTQNKNEDIKKINDFFKKDHDFYEGNGNFKKNHRIINGKLNENLSGDYEPYVFYFDQFKEQKSFIYNNFLSYKAYLNNKEDLVYNRYSNYLQEKIKKEIGNYQKDEIIKLIKEINPKFNIPKDTNFDNLSDINRKYIIDNLTKSFIETINGSKIGEFRKNVNNAGRYSGKNSKVNVDFIPYLISVLDKNSDFTIKDANKVLEDKIDNLVINGGLSRKIIIPTEMKGNKAYNYKNNIGGIGGAGYCPIKFKNFLYGQYAGNITNASQCSMFIGNNSNNGQLVEANRGLNIFNIKHDVDLVKAKGTWGYWGGNSPLNLNINASKKGKFILNSHDLKGAISTLKDIKGSKKIKDNSKIPSPLNCFKNNFLLSYKETYYWGNEGACNLDYKIPPNSVGWTPATKNPKNNYSGNFISLYKQGKCSGLSCSSGGMKISFKKISSYITHKSPTQKEFNEELNSKITPNLPINKNRYIDFISANGKYQKIEYPYLFRLKQVIYKNDDFESQYDIIAKKLDYLLDKESKKINEIIKNNNPSSLSGKDLEIYNISKIASYPLSNFDLKKYLKNLKTTKIDIYGEEKEISYYDNLLLSLFWNNLHTIGQKYKFVLQNYLSDQTDSKFKFFLPKNKKIYEIAYLNSPGTYKNMYIGIDPELKGKNPYSDIDTKNALLDAELFGVYISPIGTKKFEADTKKSLFKCAPPEGVSIFKWPSAVLCRLKNLKKFKITFGSSACSSKTLFGKKDKVKNTKFIKTCEKDENNDGVDDCLVKELEQAKIKIFALSNKIYINRFSGLQALIYDKDGKIYNNIANLKINFNLLKLEAKINENKDFSPKNTKIVYKQENKNPNSISEKNKYIDFNDFDAYYRDGVAKGNFTSQNKEANYYFQAIISIKDKEGKEKLVKKSNIIEVKVRKDLFDSSIKKLSNNDLYVGENDILASDKTNIYLIDNSSNDIFKKEEQIKKNSNSKEKLIIELNHYTKNHKKIGLYYPLKISIFKDGEKFLEDINITKNNLSNFKDLFALQKSGKYKIIITNKYGEKTSQVFNIIPEKASKVETILSTNILETNGNPSSNIFLIKDKYGNISNGYNYNIVLEASNNFKFPLNQSENLYKKYFSLSQGYTGFRIKATNKKGVGNLKIKVFDNNNKLLASSVKSIQTIDKINLHLTKTNNIKVGNNKYELNLTFTDKQGNLLKNYNSRVYFTLDNNYAQTEKAYFNIKSGKAKVELITKTLAGKNIPVDIQMEGLREIIKKYIDILPEKPVKIDINLSNDIIKASNSSKFFANIELKDKYNNLVFNDNKTKLKIEIKDKYKNIIKLNSNLIKTVSFGKSKFDFNATSEPGTAYFKVSSIPDLSQNYFEVEKENKKTKKIEKQKIYGVGEKSAKIRTYYFWDKDTFKEKKYNALYTVMLGADYGNIRKKDYLASSILFDKNNRNLAITSLLNNPYKTYGLIDIYKNGKIKILEQKENITQKTDIKANIDINNKLYFDIYNQVFDKQIARLDYNFGNNIKLGICKTTIGECLIDNSKNGIYLQKQSQEYNIVKQNNKLIVLKNNTQILKIDSNANFITNKLLKYKIDNYSNENYLLLDIFLDNSKIAKLIINISNKDIKFNIYNLNYKLKDQLINNNLVKKIYLNNFLTSDKKIDSFSANSYGALENSSKNENIGWGGENKFLLEFSSGKNVGEAVRYYQSFGTINLGDPVISLKQIQKTFKDGKLKSFTPTIGKKISNDNDIDGYRIFDYDNDNNDDILLIKNDGFLKLLENKLNSKNFLDKGNLAYIVDIGNKKFIKTGNFSGDGFDDIVFVNNKGKIALLNNYKKDFIRIDLSKQIKLKGKITQLETFDMDADGKTDIITLDDAGEINIFYGGGTDKSPKFTKKLIGNSLGLKLNNSSRNNGAIIYYDGLYQLSDKPNTNTSEINEDFLNNEIFIKKIIGADKNTGKDIYKTFIKSEYSKSAKIQITKILKDENGGFLQSGDIIDVEIKIKNISNKIQKNILFLSNIEKPFLLEKNSIKLSKGKIVNPLTGYDLYIKNFYLKPGEENIIKYKLKSPDFKIGFIKVGLFEKGEIGDDIYGDIIVKQTNKNCGDNAKIYRSITKRTYTDLENKINNCDVSKLKLPDEIEKNKIDKNNNGIPDYIDNIKKNPKDYAKKELAKFDKDNKSDLQDSLSENLDKINKWTEKQLEKMDKLMQGFSCGFGGGSCIATPLNWAPLAPGNDPTLMGKPIGDGLKVNEGIPIFSSLTNCLPTSFGCIPFVWPPISGGAGGYLGTNYSLNNFRVFASPTLTGGAGIAVCFGAPASVAGNSNPKGVAPLVPGGNCVVAAKKMFGCSEDGSDGDPSSMGFVDNIGGNYGVINGNCQYNSNKQKYIINNNFINKYYDYKNSGLGQPTTFMINEYKKVIKDYHSSIGKKNFTKTNNNNNGNITFSNQPLFSFNGNGVGNTDIEVGFNFADLKNGGFKDVIKINQKRVESFPGFLMNWVDRQVEEIVSKLTDFPTFYIIMPDFGGVIDTDWKKAEKEIDKVKKEVKNKQNEKEQKIKSKIITLENQKLSLKCDNEDKIKCYNIDMKIELLKMQTFGNIGHKQLSGLKEAYNFLGNIPIINLEPQQVNINIPWADENTLNRFLTEAKSTLKQWQEEITKYNKINGKIDTNLEELINNLNTNIQTIEEYKQIPRKLAKLLNQKEVRINQVLCSLNTISELTSGWIGRNGKRFKAWVNTYILIKAVLKSWQLLIDVFNDYDAECHECKNERQDTLNFQFKLISMVIPNIPVIRFPKWPDLILDLHNIRVSINLKIPDIVINKRPISLPNLPKLTLPNIKGDLNIKIPNMPLLPKLYIPELPDIPTLPQINLPDLPPPPKLPKIFTQLQGTLKILKLVTKAMCFLKHAPFVPEWRAGDQIAFLTERNGYLPTDFINLTTPQFSVPYLDAIKVTTYVNFEQDTSFLVDVLKKAVEPINKTTNNFINKFSNAGLGNLDFSNKSINKTKKIDLTSFSNGVVNKIINLNNYLEKNKNKTLDNNEFLYAINKSLSNSIFTKDPRTDKIKNLWNNVNNYSYKKENKLIAKLQKNNREKFENIKKILERELYKTKKAKQEIKNIKQKDLFIKVLANTKNNDFVEYKKSIQKYNNKFLKSAYDLTINKDDINQEIKNQGKQLIKRVKKGLLSFSKARNKNSLLALNTNQNNTNNTETACQKAQNSPYHYNYKGLYIIEKNKSYRLFNYLDELNGDETYKSIDFDKDGDNDLLYMMGDSIYLKENLSIQKAKSNIGEIPLELKIKDNKYFNGQRFVEAINNFKEINTQNGFLNIYFKAPTDTSINHFVVEYYNIVDKFLNENRNDNIKKNIIDAFVQEKYISYSGSLIKTHNAYINYIGDIPAVALNTFKMKNIAENLAGNNLVNIHSTTPLYTANHSVKIKYYIQEDKTKILEKTIPAYSSIRFDKNITITAINGKLFIKTDNKINLYGQDIKKYIGLPLFDKSEFYIIPDLQGKLNKNLANIEIKYKSGYKRNLNFTNIDYYIYYNLGFKNNDYLIKLEVINDYYYSKIYAIKGKTIGTYSSQELFSPQLEADTIPPEIDGLGKIRIPVYQDKTIDLKSFIYDDSGLDNIKSINIKLKQNSNISIDNYSIDGFKIKFRKFNKIFKEKIILVLEDKGENKSENPIDFEIYSPIPQILENKNNTIFGEINEDLLEEPINIYRIRGGIIKRLQTKDNKIKVYTVDDRKFNFKLKSPEKNGLYIKYKDRIIATINENTGKIILLDNNFKIVIKKDLLYPKINILDKYNNIIYSQYIRLSQNLGVSKVNRFDEIKDNGLYLKLENSNYSFYMIPNGAKYSAGVGVIYKKSDNLKTALFTIFPDGRINFSNKYKLSYKKSGEYIIFELYSKIGNKKIAELLIKINASYLMN